MVDHDGSKQQRRYPRVDNGGRPLSMGSMEIEGDLAQQRFISAAAAAAGPRPAVTV